MKRITAIVIAITFGALMFTGCSLFSKPLSEDIVGEWNGQIDVAQVVYKELGDELGIELSPEPAYCPIQLKFDEDNTAVMIIDNEGFAKAVGQCVEPYLSGIFSFDTSGLVDVLMQYVAKDMGSESGTDEYTYQVDDENETVTLSADGESMTLQRNDDGALELPDDGALGQTIVFEKAE